MIMGPMRSGIMCVDRLSDNGDDTDTPVDGLTMTITDNE